MISLTGEAMDFLYEASTINWPGGIASRVMKSMNTRYRPHDRISIRYRPHDRISIRYRPHDRISIIEVKKRLNELKRAKTEDPFWS
jgi:hypothetical protein